MTIYQVSETCAVAGQIQATDVPSLAADGFVTVICNRPDNEDFGQPPASDIEAECERHGIAFHHIPIDRGLSMEQVERFREAVKESAGKVLAYCRTGQRSSVIWHSSGAP